MGPNPTDEKQRSFLSVFGEIGVEVQPIAHPKASPHPAALLI